MHVCRGISPADVRAVMELNSVLMQYIYVIGMDCLYLSTTDVSDTQNNRAHFIYDSVRTCVQGL